MLWLRELCSFMSKEQRIGWRKERRGEERRDSNSDSLTKTSFNSFFLIDRVVKQDVHSAPHHVFLTVAPYYGFPLAVKKVWHEMSDTVRTSGRSTVWLTGDSNVTIGFSFIYHIHHFLRTCDEALSAALSERNTCTHSFVQWKKKGNITIYTHSACTNILCLLMNALICAPIYAAQRNAHIYLYILYISAQIQVYTLLYCSKSLTFCEISLFCFLG